MYRLAVATIVIALVGCSIGAAPSDSTTSAVEPSDAQAAPPTSSPSASAATASSLSPSAPASAPRITWSEVPFDGHIVDIIGDGARFVAVGAGSSGTSAWTSVDGMSWEEHDVPEQAFGELPDGSEFRAGMRTLVRLGDTLYSFGATGMFMDGSHGAGWRWTDGQAWEAIQSASQFFAGEVIAVTASEEALVASTVTFGGPRGTFDTWRWTPATSWVRVSVPVEVVLSALTWADGTFLAAAPSAPGADAQPSMWSSADGVDWSSVGIPDDMSDVCALTSTSAGRFVALGRAGDRIAAWTSTDGATWVEGTMERADPSGMTGDTLSLPAACSVVATDDGLVAVMQGNDALIWTSADGVSWEFQEALDVLVRPLAAVGRHVLLANTFSDQTEPDGIRQVVLVGVLEP